MPLKLITHLDISFFAGVPMPAPVRNQAANFLGSIIENILGKPLFYGFVVVVGVIGILFFKEK